jgi:hypothetical protein
MVLSDQCELVSEAPPPPGSSSKAAAPLDSASYIHAALAFSVTTERLIDTSDDVCRALIRKRIVD